MTRGEPINRTIAALAITVLICGTRQVSIADDSSVTLEKVIEAWKARERDTKSFDFRWSAGRWRSKLANGAVARTG